jgi:hypothetical protein
MKIQKVGRHELFASTKVCYLSRAARAVGRVSGRVGVRRP